jgi:GT2 family glycosyltransferase
VSTARDGNARPCWTRSPRCGTIAGRDRGPEAATLIEISVIVPHYDDLENLSLCLDLLDRQSLKRDRFEIVVSDNNSSCGLPAVEAVVRGRARVVLATEKGAGPARNRGVASASGQAFAFIDSDCRPVPDWLRAGLEGLATHPIVGGPVIMEPRDLENVSGVEAFDVVFGFDALAFLKDHGFIGSGNLFVRREVFERVGGFRSGVSEDVEWSRRAVGLGYALAFVPEAVVGHPARRDWRELVRKWDRHTRESYLLAREKRLGRLAWMAKSWLVLASPLPHAVKVLRCERLPSWKSRLAGTAVLFRIRLYRFLESHRVMSKVNDGPELPPGRTVTSSPGRTDRPYE